MNIRKEPLDEQEDDFYQALYTQVSLPSRDSGSWSPQSQAQFNTYVNAGTVLNNYAHIFDILIRLRQVVDHPYLVLFRAPSAGTSEPSASASQTESEVLCEICHETPIDPRWSSCRHIFCLACISDFLQVEDADTTATCPTCQASLSIDLSAEVPEGGSLCSLTQKSLGRKNFLRHIDLQKFQSSTKLEALMQVGVGAEGSADSISSVELTPPGAVEDENGGLWRQGHRLQSVRELLRCEPLVLLDLRPTHACPSLRSWSIESKQEG